MTRTLTLTLMLSLAGCYGSARSTIKPADVPQLIDGGKADVDIQETHYWSRNQLRYVKSYVADSLTYNEEPLNYNQFRTLTDPTWTAKLAEHAELVKSCRRANIPRYIGYASVVAGSMLLYYGGFLFGNNATLQYTVGFGGLGVGLASYATGWAFFGGRKCTEANELAARLHLDEANKTKIYDDDLIVEVGTIAKQFNRRMKRAAKQAAEAPAP